MDMVTLVEVVKEVRMMAQNKTSLKKQTPKMTKRRKDTIHEMRKKRMNYSFMTCTDLA